MKISEFRYLKVQRTVYICRKGIKNVIGKGTAYRNIFFDDVFKVK